MALESLLFMAACSQPVETPALKEAPKTEQTVLTPAEKPKPIPPRSHLKGESAVLENPGSFANTEEFETQKEALKQKWALRLNEYKANKDEPVAASKHLIDKVLVPFLREDVATLDSGKQTLPHVNTELKKRNIIALARVVNEYFHPLGFHVFMSAEEGVFHTAIHPITETDTIVVEDHMEKAEFPIYYLGEDELEGKFKALPAGVGAKTYFEEGYIAVLPGHGEANSKRIIELLKPTGFTEPKDFQAFVRSDVEDTLNHEGAHLLLMTRRFPNTQKMDACKPLSVKIDIPGYSAVKMEGCYRPFEIHEVCGFATAFAYTKEAALWEAAGNLEPSLKQTYPNYGFYWDVSYPYFFAAGQSPLRDDILDSFDKTGTASIPKIRDFLREDVGVKGLNQVGREMYEMCYGLLESL